MKSKTKPRPLVINCPDFLSKDEARKILELANQICDTFKESRVKLDKLVSEYRDLVGFDNVDLCFEEQTEDGDYENQSSG